MIRTDGSYFYLDNIPFCPEIVDIYGQNKSERKNTVMLEVPLDLDSDLIFSALKDKADLHVQEGKYLFWDLNFGLKQPFFSFENERMLSAFLLAIDVFLNELWSVFSTHTLGVNLYRAAYPFHPQFQEKVRWEDDFNMWKRDFPNLPCAYDFYCLQQLSDYLHRLATPFPDEVMVFSLFDASFFSSPSLIGKLFSKEIFPHLHLGINTSFQAQMSLLKWDQECLCVYPHKIDLGVVLPSNLDFTFEAQQTIDRHLHQLETDRLAYRLISESYLTEYWTGLERLIYFDSYLSRQGERKLKGFQAAAGQIEKRVSERGGIA